MTSDVTVIGGGLAGLINAILLAKRGVSVTLLEKKSYPFHKVCGEYISNEVIPFLQKNDLYPAELEPVDIRRFRLSSIGGNTLSMALDLGGFGITRYDFDRWLAQRAVEAGVHLMQSTTVENIHYRAGQFEVVTRENGAFESPVAIGAYGKKSRLDHSLDRRFTRKYHPFIGVKYHIRTEDVDPDVIELHNFEGGYCGVSRVGSQLFNLCYLASRHQVKQHGSIEKMEVEVLRRNPHLRRILDNAEHTFKRPEVINEITFDRKEAIKGHLLMCGDAAGMITPLCGNGMAMAIHSAELLSGILLKYIRQPDRNRTLIENEYTHAWNRQFRTRHWAGRNIQSMLFGSRFSSGLAVGMGKYLPAAAQFLMRQTHGNPF